MALTLLLQEFKENCNIENAIIDYQRKENKFSIFIYCLEKYIDIKKERNRFLHLYYKHGLSYHLWYGQQIWELPEEKWIISTKSTYFSTYIFSFRKQKVDSFFSLYRFFCSFRIKVIKVVQWWPFLFLIQYLKIFI